MADLVITIDGPAASGKSTVAQRLAERLGASFLDTGAMYRAVTLAAMQAKVDLTDERALLEVLDKKQFRFEVEGGRMVVWVDGVDLSRQIRSQEVTGNVHYIADSAAVRSRLVAMQRAFATEHGRVVTEGRDQGTVVFADADVKFYLLADAAERARRRCVELSERGKAVDIEDLENEILARDREDIGRGVGALKRAEGAIVVDSTNLSIEEVIEKVLTLVKENVDRE
jgi:cytidylate kinase